MGVRSVDGFMKSLRWLNNCRELAWCIASQPRGSRQKRLLEMTPFAKCWRV